MASTAPSTTTTADPLNLTPPDPVPPVTLDKAAGLVPLDEEKRSKLDEKVDAFIDDLVAQDANSPEFGQRVDQLTNMGRKEIAEAAGHSNRFLDRPVRAMDSDNKVGADLAHLRRTVEDSIPASAAIFSRPRSCSGLSPSATSCATISTVIRAPKGTSTRSSARWPAARMSSSRTMPRSMSSARICGRPWAALSR